MKKIMHDFYQRFEKVAGFRVYALTLLLAMFLAYDLLVARMGFNYDDWEGIFLYGQGFSAKQVWDYFLIDRPFSSIVHWLFHPILGTSAVGWHLLVLLLHWGAILFLVKSILEIFPGRVMAAGWIGLLLGVFPGIARQFVARTSAPHYFSMFLFALSLWLMLRAVKETKINWPLLGFSALLGLAQSLIIEYFASMEIARFFILWYLFYSRENGSLLGSLRRAFVPWLPYLAVFLVFAYFKFAILPALAITEELVSKHEISLFSSLVNNPAGTITNYINLIVQDVIYVLFYAWATAITPADFNLAAKSYLLSWLLGALVAAFCALATLAWYRKQGNDSDAISKPGFVVGVLFIILLLGGLPAWLIGRQGITGLWSSRFFLAQVLGAVPLVVLAVIAIAGKHRQHVANLVLAILFAMSFSMQFRDANRYTLYWNYQRDYYWQLKWRAPGLVDKSFILSPYTPMLRNSDYQIAYAINLAYAPGHNNTDSKHWWFDGPDTLRNFSRGEYLQDTEVKASMRNIIFESDMSFAVPVIHRSSRGCLQVILDDYYLDQPGLSIEEKQMFGLGNPDLVLQDGLPMPENIFGREPERNWCYYYQKTELARQFDNWDEILAIWETISEKNLSPTYGPEYLPFIDVLARQGDWPQAAQITIKAGKITKDARPFLCTFWQTALNPDSAPEERNTQWEHIKEELGCR